jgi:hypothetical protein
VGSLKCMRGWLFGAGSADYIPSKANYAHESIGHSGEYISRWMRTDSKADQHLFHGACLGLCGSSDAQRPTIHPSTRRHWQMVAPRPVEKGTKLDERAVLSLWGTL